MFEKPKWIWNKETHGEDQYAEFCDTFEADGSAKMRISVCGDYTLFVNGKYAASNQYGDFDHYKIYDTIDITQYLQKGANTVSILVWYFGKSGMRYFTDTPGLIYEVESNGTIVAASSGDTPSRKSRAYQSGRCKKISNQLGYGFKYDATRQDGWLSGDLKGFDKSEVVQKACRLYPRPIAKHRSDKLLTGRITSEGCRYIVDLGQEVVGLCSLKFASDRVQSINVAYGELLENGGVKRCIGDRDFSFDYVAVKGGNEYTNYMLRLACRYIEINSEYPIDIEYAGIIPQVYPVERRTMQLPDELDRRIYDICVNTLEKCMMEHYVDCPWREQCLYAFDSRNQMLSGYYAFEGGNYDYARANLLLISKDRREDNILSICFPSNEKLSIPSFSLHYIVAVCEYMQHSGDMSLGAEVMQKLQSLLRAFLDNTKDGLVCRFPESYHWNFYDWSEYMEGRFGKEEGQKSDFMINCLMVMALNSYDKICSMLGCDNLFAGRGEQIAKAADKAFFNEESGLYFVSGKTEKPTELANSLAVVCGIAKGERGEYICQKLVSGKLIECSLSMKAFKYDALLATDSAKYKPAVLDEIRATYKPMLDFGSDTVWETAAGASDFDNAGSLCHGWSAIPVYYYHKFVRDI
ncbi:MAG: family 78 glycoside hydrolase catalytic domain [Clostridia bacterium]|nr:family 78 glycoside hydrolase catalytic domain [Clostridia bacterium]